MSTKNVEDILLNSKELRDLILSRLSELNIPKSRLCAYTGIGRSSFDMWWRKNKCCVGFEKIMLTVNSLGIFVKVIDKNIVLIKYPLDCSIFDYEYQLQTNDEVAEVNSLKEKYNYGKNLAETIRRLSDYDDKRFSESLGKS